MIRLVFPLTIEKNALSVPYPFELLPSFVALTVRRHLVTTQPHINLLHLLEAFAACFPNLTGMARVQFLDIIEHELADL